MRVLTRLEDLGNQEVPFVLAAGVFDGFHFGHQAVLRRAVEEAAKLNAEAGVLTFHPHPAAVLRPECAPRFLASRSQKLDLLQATGLPLMIEVPFDAGFARQSPEEFIENLVRCSNGCLAGICVGASWSFGRGRKGNVKMLQTLGDQFSFQVFAVPPVLLGGSPVSSTRIRQAIERGDLDEAEQCLGRRYSIRGEVLRGAQLGRKLGFPTANLSFGDAQLPPNGVYAVEVLHAGNRFSGVANLGLRPTVEKEPGKRVLEVHLLDFSGEVYGEELEVGFVRFLRGEHRFPDLDSLRQQIAKDVEQANLIFAS